MIKSNVTCFADRFFVFIKLSIIKQKKIYYRSLKNAADILSNISHSVFYRASKRTDFVKIE